MRICREAEKVVDYTPSYVAMRRHGGDVGRPTPPPPTHTHSTHTHTTTTHKRTAALSLLLQ